jgi:hypothetical protein
MGQLEYRNHKALIIREFMIERGIQDCPEGIRAFYAFEWARLSQLEF